ncbi:MAG: hypothetical protein JWO12_2887 [Frankiales bacterium]|nr:hypothetical protein [Frankiales bacterium]
MSISSVAMRRERPLSAQDRRHGVPGRRRATSRTAASVTASGEADHRLVRWPRLRSHHGGNGGQRGHVRCGRRRDCLLRVWGAPGPAEPGLPAAPVPFRGRQDVRLAGSSVSLGVSDGPHRKPSSLRSCPRLHDTSGGHWSRRSTVAPARRASGSPSPGSFSARRAPWTISCRAFFELSTRDWARNEQDEGHHTAFLEGLRLIRSTPLLSWTLVAVLGARLGSWLKGGLRSTSSG